jgi:uncharacterized protein (DUF952 family)
VPVYKILLPAEWARFEASGRFDGSPLDQAGGFIHLSGREQVAGTAARLFADAGALVLVVFDADAFGDQLRWEDTPDGGRYPHLYGSLTRDAIVAVHHIPDATAVEAALTSPS